MKDITMFEIFIAPINFFPIANSKGYKLLALFAQSNRIYREELVWELGDTFRVDIQALDGEFHRWLIHREKVNNKVVYIELDDRHYSMNIELDNEARLERKKMLTEQSHKEAKLGRIREPVALTKMTNARSEYFISLGDAANDSDTKNKNH